jgi:hypothetical protein
MNNRFPALLLAFSIHLPAAAAPTIAAEGFSSDITPDKRPVDSITRGRMGSETVHWVRWTGMEPGRQLRHTCQVFEPGESKPAFSEDSVGAPASTEDVTFCAYTPISGYAAGTWTFVQLFDGVKVSEAQIEIIEPSLVDRIGKGKLALGVVALLALGWFAMRKREA